MGFRFRAWERTIAFGRPQEAVSAFTARVAQLGRRLPELPSPDIVFEVVDIRPSTTKPDQIVNALADLLLDRGRIGSFLKPNSRLLFAGQARSLAYWEPEDKQRSIASDVELFVRALQSLDVGHYVCVEPGTTPASDRTEPAAAGPDWITSALFALQRHYSPPENRQANAVKRVNQLRRDIAKLFNSAQDRKGFERLGVEGDYKERRDPRDDRGLLNEIRLLYQLGKRDRFSRYSPDREFERGQKLTVEIELPSTSYELLNAIETKVAPWASKYKLGGTIRGKGKDKAGHDVEIPHPMGATGDEEAAQWLAGATFKMKRYEMLRDLGRVIGSNAVTKVRERIEKQRAAGLPLFLVIDDFIYFHLAEGRRHRNKDSGHVVNAIKRVFRVVNCRPEDFVVVPARTVRCEASRLAGEPHRKVFYDDGKPPVTLNGKPAAALEAPEKYAAILIDPETTSDALGPARIQRIAHHLRQVRARAKDAESAKIPSIIAFSQRESAGQVQQCLNLGAAAFTAKHRPYHLLFDLNRVLQDSRPDRLSTDKASQFRILKSMKPHTAAKLRRGTGPAYLHGGLYSPTESRSPTLDDFLDDPREVEWIRSLPKADLHCHIGTCIDYPTVELMALNTVGYTLGSLRLRPTPNKDGVETRAVPAAAPRGAQPEIEAADGLRVLIEKTASIVVLASRLTRDKEEPGDDGSDAPALIRLAAATAAIIPGTSGLSLKPFGMGDAIIDRLRSVDERCKAFQVGALLVATICVHPRLTSGAAPYRAAEGALAYLNALAKDASRGPGSRSPDTAEDFTTGAALAHAVERAINRLEEISHRWDGRFTEGQIRDAIRKDAPGEALDLLIQSLRGRTTEAERVLKAFLHQAEKRTPANDPEAKAARERALKWLRDNDSNARAADPAAADAHPLEPYVIAARAPERDGRRSGLQLYLQGADLLGSAHLQFPENLLLATYAIARDNAEDNIIYSEVRCETTGYTKAGMSAIDATEMLRHGFNMASLFLASQTAAAAGPDGEETGPLRRWPLVRTNILLAAKRHKSREEARKVVGLLESYLERRPGEVELALSRLRFPQPFPPWWRPAEVVGFDVSGDESKDQDWLADVIKPLAERSSPITIHAGEAADAQSIWRAVYSLNATRIGHGLRLNEDQALLSYCVREGICMEMCPNSNAATNGFRCIPAFDTSPYPLLQYEYPLLQYMRAGMEVSLGTDNRYLHSPGRRNLTSEYVAAARLVGGLTRWEVLQIVKAGFKNAFLAKVEISEMLGAVEETIYNLVASSAA